MPLLAFSWVLRAAGFSRGKQTPRGSTTGQARRHDIIRKDGFTANDTLTIEDMLKKSPGGVGADELRKFLEDPMID